MLSRQSMQNGNFLGYHEGLVASKGYWSAEMLRASMQSILEERPAGAPVWLFAYGSLMWNPTIAIEEMQRARIEGWQRRFCIRLLTGRATPEYPGRMLSLDEGGMTEGMIFRIPECSLDSELSIIWMREMITGLYKPVWTDALTSTGETIKALTFVSDREHPCYECDSTASTSAEFISQACGELGTNREYVDRLNTTLTAWGINDNYVSSILLNLKERERMLDKT